jgi:hypothetical protein
MPFVSQCPGCDRRWNCADHHEGRSVTCNCGGTFVVRRPLECDEATNMPFVSQCPGCDRRWTFALHHEGRPFTCRCHGTFVVRRPVECDEVTEEAPARRRLLPNWLVGCLISAALFLGWILLNMLMPGLHRYVFGQ